jgi:hypothetical protein
MRALRIAGSALSIRLTSLGVRHEGRHPARDRWREAARLNIPEQASICLKRGTKRDSNAFPSAMGENSQNGKFS